jgi:tetratricopeptide (TPR) repeat protein
VSAQPLRDSVDEELARKHFAAGAELYDRGDYAGALKELEAARMHSHAPALDFNVGRCHDRMERLPEAIAAYQRYVDSHPSDADEVKARIALLQERLAAATPPPSATATLAVSPPPPERPVYRRAWRRSWFWGVVAGAVVVAGGAIALGVAFGARTTDYPSPTLGSHLLQP